MSKGLPVPPWAGEPRPKKRPHPESNPRVFRASQLDVKRTVSREEKERDRNKFGKYTMYSTSSESSNDDSGEDADVNAKPRDDEFERKDVNLGEGGHEEVKNEKEYHNENEDMNEDEDEHKEVNKDQEGHNNESEEIHEFWTSIRE
jgi:hypothetical protein